VPDPKQIAVVTPAGDVRTIASTDAADAAEQGFELATPEQVKGAKNQAKFDEASALGKAGYVAGAAGAGALRGLSAGLSDAALIHGAGLLGKDSATATRETLNELRDVAPTASLLGEGAGMIGGLALGSGEVGVGGKALTAVSRAGGLAERGAARLLGEGATSLAGRVAQRGLATAASGAVEGALYGAGSTISEAALGDENLTGEKLVAGMGHGALVGGALGAAFGGVSGAFSRGRAGKLSDMIAEREAATAARAETSRATGVADDVFAAKKPPIGAEIPQPSAAPAQGAFAGAAAAPSEAADVELLTRGVRTAREKVEGFTGKTISELADKEAVAHTIKTLGATQGQVQKLAKFGDVSAAAKDIYREVEAYTKHDFMRATKQDILDTSKAVLGKTNEIKRGMLSELDGAGVAAPSIGEIRNRFEQEVMAPHIARYETRIIDGEAITKPVFMAGKKADFAPALDFLKQMESSDVRTFEDLFRETRNLRQKTKFGAGPTPNEQAHLMDLFNVAENQIESAAEARAPGFVKKWQEIKKLQQSMIFAKEASERGINAAIKNNSIGLRAGLGVAAGVATGSPIGALIAAGLGKAVNEYGDQIAASAFTKLSALTKLRQNVARVDGQVAHGVQKLFGKALPRGAVSDLVDFMSGATIKAAEKVAEDAGIKAAAAKAAAVEAAATRAPDAVAKAQVAAAARAEATGAAANVASLRQQAAEAAAAKPRSRIEYGGAIRSAATYAATRKTERENYYAEANDIRMSAARPGALTERIAENLAPYAGSAPKAVAAASATAVRGVTFLASKLPPSGTDPTSLTPQLEKPDRMTSDIAITKWMKYKRAVDNPLSVLSDAKSGKLTPEAVEAVKFVYPKIYEQLCDTVIRATVDAKRPLTYQESIRVGILLDRPTDWSMTPSAQKVIQSTYALPQQPPNRVSSGGKKINLASTYETTTTRVMSR